MEGETVSEAKEEEEPVVNTQLVEEIVREKEQKKEEQERKKADDLWSSFMSDVGKGPPKKTAPAGSGLGSLGSINRVSLICFSCLIARKTNILILIV